MDETWKEWLTKVMLIRPQNNAYLDSDRGIEVTKLCLSIERKLPSWRRSDTDTFWIDMQLFVKYKLSDEDITFIEKMQPGIEAYRDNAKERHAYSQMMKSFETLKKIFKGEDHEAD